MYHWAGGFMVREVASISEAAELSTAYEWQWRRDEML